MTLFSNVYLVNAVRNLTFIASAGFCRLCAIRHGICDGGL
jgi:hypothetical protein